MAPSRPDARRSRALLAAWLVAIFAISACRDLPVLGGAALAAALLLRRGLGRNLRRTLRSVVPVTVGLSLASFAWLRLVAGAWPPAGGGIVTTTEATLPVLL